MDKYKNSIPIFYYLPKVYKNKTPTPLRPVVAMIRSILCILGK